MKVGLQRNGFQRRGQDFNQGVERDKGLWRNETHYRISNENWSIAGVSKLLKKIATTGQESGTLNIPGAANRGVEPI